MSRSPRHLVVALAALAAAALGCGDGRKVLSLQVAGPESLPAAWSTTRLSVDALYSDGSRVDVTPRVSWSSSDLTTASVDADGTIHSVRRGRVTITAALEGAVSSATLQIPGIRLLRREPVPVGAGLLPVAVGVDSAERVTVLGSPRDSGTGVQLEVAHLTSIAASTWDRTSVLMAPAPDGVSAQQTRRLVMNDAGRAAYLFTQSTSSSWAGAVAYLEGGRWGWVHDVPFSWTVVEIDDAGTVFAAYPRWGDRTAPPVSVAVERLDATGLLETVEFAGTAVRLSLATAAGRTMLLCGGIGTRVFDGNAWSGVAPLTAALAAPELRLRDDGTADLVDHAGQIVTARRYDGTAWGAPLVLASTAARAAVAFGPRGTAALVYAEVQPVRLTRTRLLLRLFDGAAWSEPTEISGDFPVGITPTLLLSAQGRTVVLWASGTAPRAGLRVWASTLDGAPPVEETLGDGSDLDTFTLLPSGDLLVVSSSAPGIFGVAASIYGLQP